MPLTVDNIGQVERVKTDGSNMFQPLAADGSRIRVLAIDDNEEFRNLTTELLEPFGFEVIAEANPVRALEKFAREKDKFQLVLLDYNMPQLDGAKTFECLKKLSPDVKVIIVSGVEELRLRPILAHHQVDGYIRKPFRIQEALHLIRHVMSKPAGKTVAH
jgi:two-component system cell cycle sensor histidine kinase/response regulator CckA